MLEGHRERAIAAVVGLIASAPLITGIVVWVREAVSGAGERTSRQLTA
jgi:hypothetical protein